MPIQAINGNDNRSNNMFTSATKGAAIGAAGGFVGKYVLPLTFEEKLNEKYIDKMAGIEHEKTTFNAHTKQFIRTIAGKLDKNPAEDEFVQMFKDMRKGGKLEQSQIDNSIAKLQKNFPEYVPAFKKLYQESLDLAEKNAKQAVKLYNLFTKHIRPTGFFVAVGAIAGTFIALANNVMKTEIKAPSIN